MRTISIIASSLLLTFVAAAPAVAQDNSSIDQYTENIPAGGGEQGSGSGGSGTGSGSELPTGVADEFEAAGADGAAAAALAQSTAPASSGQGGADGANGGSGSQGGTGGEPQPSGTTADSDGGGGLGTVIGEVLDSGSDESGLGIVLPIVIGAALLAAIAVVITRVRSHTSA